VVNPLQWVAVAFLLWLTALVCCACTPLHAAPMLVDERRAIDAAQAGWEGATGAHCRALDTIEVIYEWAPCGNRNSADCVRMNGRRQAIVVREGQPVVDSLGGAIVHGGMHACEGVAGHAHLNPVVWIAAGGALSAQGRARDLLLAD
jgi:hypothetical protein